MRDCGELFDKLSAYLDGELEGADLARVLRHLEKCECCAKCVETLRATRAVMARAQKPVMPEDMKQRLKECLRRNAKD